MSNFFSLFILIYLVFLAACSPDKAPPEPLLVAGKYTVVNYWAQWCKPCREEIPELNALAADYANDVIVYGINFDGVEGDTLTALGNDFGIKYASTSINAGQQLGITKPIALPTTVIFDRDGKLLISLVGPQTTKSLAQYFTPKN